MPIGKIDLHAILVMRLAVKQVVRRNRNLEQPEQRKQRKDDIGKDRQCGDQCHRVADHPWLLAGKPVAVHIKTVQTVDRDRQVAG